MKEVIAFFAETFTQGRRNRALTLLDSHTSPLRKKDAILLTYFAGLLTMIIVLLIALLIIP